MLKNSQSICFSKNGEITTLSTASQQPLGACVALERRAVEGPSLARASEHHPGPVTRRQSTQAQREGKAGSRGLCYFCFLGQRQESDATTGGSQRSAHPEGRDACAISADVNCVEKNRRPPSVRPTGKPRFSCCLLCLMQDFVFLREGWEFQ